MNFSRALELLKQGKKIKRRHWGGYWFISFVQVHEDFSSHINVEAPLMIIAKTKDGRYAPATAYQEDLLADDWEVVE
jgi:hypothetical protein